MDSAAAKGRALWFGISNSTLIASRRGLIAEAWARRRYKNAFVEKLTQALAEAKETQAWLDHAEAQGHLNEHSYETLDDEWDHICAMIRRMIQRADDFCGND